MEEKKTQPGSSSPKASHSEISTILQSMIKEEGTPPSPVDAKTPLGNLKNILSRADASATSRTSGQETKETVPPVISVKTVDTEKNLSPKLPIPPKTSLPLDIFSSGPVAELERLIKTHRAGSLKR